MLSFLALHIYAYLLSTSGNSALLSDITAMLAAEGYTVGQNDVIAELNTLVSDGKISYNSASTQATVTLSEGAYTVTVDPDVDPEIGAALQALADSIGGQGGPTLASFLANVRSAGVDAPDALVGINILREVGFIAAAKIGESRLRKPIMDAIKVLNVTKQALVANPA